MTTRAREAISALRQAQDHLTTFVSGAAPETLGRQSGASAWTVGDVLSHLGSAAEIGLATLTTGKADMAGAPAIWDRWNAMSPLEQAAGFVTTGELLGEALEALDDGALADRRVDVGFLPAPIDILFFATMRLSEMGLHTWDIEVAFDPDATVGDDVVPFVLDQLPAFAGFFAKPDRAGIVAIETTHPERGYVLEMTSEGARLSEGFADGPGTRVRLPAESLVRLTSGRLGAGRPADAVIEGALTLDDLRRILPGY